MSQEEPPEWFKKWEADKRRQEAESMRSLVKVLFAALVFALLVKLLLDIGSGDWSTLVPSLGFAIAALVVYGPFLYLMYMSTKKHED